MPGGKRPLTREEERQRRGQRWRRWRRWLKPAGIIGWIIWATLVYLLAERHGRSDLTEGPRAWTFWLAAVTYWPAVLGIWWALFDDSNPEGRR